MHEKEADGEVDDATMLGDYEALVQAMKENRETRERFIGEVVRENLAHRFQHMHGTSINDYVDRKIAKYRMADVSQNA